MNHFDLILLEYISLKKTPVYLYFRSRVYINLNIIHIIQFSVIVSNEWTNITYVKEYTA